MAPPRPKLFIDMYGLLNSSTSVTTRILFSANASISDRILVTFIFGAIVLFSKARRIFAIDATPEEASACPMFDFVEPTASGFDLF